MSRFFRGIRYLILILAQYIPFVPLLRLSMSLACHNMRYDAET
jgi:hypothetical protein